MIDLQWGLRFLTMLAVVLLAGCATNQPPVAMDQNFWNEKNDTIGVAMNETPTPSVRMVGQQGFLDVAFNNAMAEELKAKVATWDASSMDGLKETVASDLEQQGFSVVTIQKPFNYNDYEKNRGAEEGYLEIDVTPLKQRYDIDKLIILSSSAGTSRSYYGMIPTSDPVALSSVSTVVVDLDDNRLVYFEPTQVTKPASGDWDEAPDYPNLTNAFYQALDESQQITLAPFIAHHLSSS